MNHAYSDMYDALREEAGATEQKTLAAVADLPILQHLASKEDLVQALGEIKIEIADEFKGLYPFFLVTAVKGSTLPSYSRLVHLSTSPAPSGSPPPPRLISCRSRTLILGPIERVVAHRLLQLSPRHHDPCRPLSMTGCTSPDTS